MLILHGLRIYGRKFLVAGWHVPWVRLSDSSAGAKGLTPTWVTRMLLLACFSDHLLINV